MERQYIVWHTAAGCATAIVGFVITIFIIASLFDLLPQLLWLQVVVAFLAFLTLFSIAHLTDRHASRSRSKRSI